MNKVFETKEKLLVEQAWNLQFKFERLINQSRKSGYRDNLSVSVLDKDRLNHLYNRAHTRYKRRLQKLWQGMGCKTTSMLN